MLLFFFSSRRRHTRLTCDWSSDVCSSDLTTAMLWTVLPKPTSNAAMNAERSMPGINANSRIGPSKIGRASCRERGEISEVEGASKKQQVDRRQEVQGLPNETATRVY